MFIVNNPVTVRWEIEPTDTPLEEADYDISVITPTVKGSYTDAGVTNFQAPTALKSGNIEYTLTAKYVGRYTLHLTTGTGLSHTVIDKQRLHVFSEVPPLQNSLKAWASRAIATDSVTITSERSVFAFATDPIDIATDGNGNWVILCKFGRVYYTSDLINFTLAVSPVSSVEPQSIATDGNGRWLAFGQGGATRWTSDDNGVTWIERWDGAGGWNSVGFSKWSPVTQKFYTNGQNQSRYSLDGEDPWVLVTTNNNAPRFFLHTPTQLWMAGWSGVGNGRWSWTTSNISWNIEDDFPNTNGFDEVPGQDGDWGNGIFVVAAGTAGLEYRYWVHQGVGWDVGTHLRYDPVKTDRIEMLKYVKAQDLWYIATAIGDVYTSPNPLIGVDSWTLITTGVLASINKPLNIVQLVAEEEGGEAWVWIEHQTHDLIINRF